MSEFRFQWDERKRASNLLKHGLDFVRAVELFSNPFVVLPARSVGDEFRQKAVGLVLDLHVTVIFTPRGETIRVISMRRAREDERRAYQELHGG